MFNKCKYCKELKKELETLRERIRSLEGLLTVSNFFQDCPCCNSQSIITKFDAIPFKKMFTRYGGYQFAATKTLETLYTTEESYKIHKEKIAEWEKEVEEYLKSKNATPLSP